MKIIDLLDVMYVDEEVMIIDNKDSEIIRECTVGEIPEKLYNHNIKKVYSSYYESFDKRFYEIYTRIIIEI